MKRAWALALLVAVTASALETQGSAVQARQGEPASVLIFPLIDSRPSAGRVTLVVVTNTNTDNSRPVGSPVLTGDVAVHFNYVQGDAPWTWISRRETLTPGDTLAVVAAQHAPTVDHGFLVAVAEDPVTQTAVRFNHLCGFSLVIDLVEDLAWAVTTWGFQAHPANGGQPMAASLGGHPFTDLAANGGNMNGAVDFDGKEYARFPDLLYLSSFIEGRAGLIEGEIALLSPMNPIFRIGVVITVYNDQGESIVVSRELKIWTHMTLFDFSPYTSALGGEGAIPAGWLTVDGLYAVDLASGTYWGGEGEGRVDPPLIGVCAQRVRAGGSVGYGVRLASDGGQNGNEFPPDTYN